MLGRRYSPSFLQGTRPRFASDTLMSLRAIPSCLAWVPSAAVEDICTFACIGIRGALRSRRGAVDARWFRVCAPCLANWGGGGLSPFWSVAWWLVFCVWGGGGLSPFSLLRGGWMFGLVRRVFRKRPQGVTRTLSAAKQGESGASGGRVPLRRRGGNMRRGSLLHGGLMLAAYQSVTPVRASPNTAVN